MKIKKKRLYIILICQVSESNNLTYFGRQLCVNDVLNVNYGRLDLLRPLRIICSSNI